MRAARALLLALAASSCAEPPSTNLPAALQGIDKAKFLACAGPPSLEMNEGGQDRMSFITNLKRGSMIGLGNPTSFPVESCQADAVFVNGRLASSRFGGNPSMCQAVFAPCLGR